MTKALLLGLALALAGCGTVDGIGQDISDGSRMVRGWL
jgi:predicted small secreted protein